MAVLIALAPKTAAPIPAITANVINPTGDNKNPIIAAPTVASADATDAIKPGKAKSAPFIAIIIPPTTATDPIIVPTSPANFK